MQNSSIKFLGGFFMRQKHKLTKIFKLVTVIALMACLLMSSIPITNAASQTDFKNFSIDDIEIIQFTNGYYTEDYDYDKDEYVKWYNYYYSSKIVGTATLTDGSTVDIDYAWISDNDVNITDDQSVSNQWGLGSHQVTAELEGIKTTFNVNIVKPPVTVKSIEINDIDIVECTSGYYTKEYDYDKDEYVEWYKYNDFDVSGTMTFNDGTSCDIRDGSFNYKDTYYPFNFENDQSYENQWDIGTHKVVAKAFGFETSFNCNIKESPYASIEILSVAPVKEKENSWDYEYALNFIYKVTYKDGRVEQRNSDDYYDDNPTISIIGDWQIGKENEFIAHLGKATAKGYAEVIPDCGFDFVAQNDGIYITNCTLEDEDIIIPEEIAGKW